MSTQIDKFSLHVAIRLLEERERLFASQEDAGARCGVSRVMWGQYERGQAAPGGAVWLKLAAAGADVQYILTGQRSAQALTRDEVELLEQFRAAPLAVKAAAIGALQGGSAPPKSTQTAKVKQAGADNVFQQSQGGANAETGTGRKSRTNG